MGKETLEPNLVMLLKITNFLAKLFQWLCFMCVPNIITFVPNSKRTVPNIFKKMCTSKYNSFVPKKQNFVPNHNK